MLIICVSMPLVYRYTLIDLFTPDLCPERDVHETKFFLTRFSGSVVVNPIT